VNTAVDTLIIGGGPSGLTAASFCSKPSLVLEQSPTPSRKLLATGGGRCNLTHEGSVNSFAPLFGEAARFVLPALHAFPPKAIREFFHAKGMQTVVEADGCVFPASQKASDVRDVLLRAAQEARATLQCGVRVERFMLEPEKGTGQQRIAGVITSVGMFAPRCVVLAAGGQSYPELGSDGSGFALARSAGLEVAPPVPALAGLLIPAEWVVALSGLLCEQGSLWIEGKGTSKKQQHGPILFTHKGISGPPALALSGAINARLLAENEVTIRVSFRSDRRVTDWLSLFDQWRQQHGNRSIHNLLSGELPRALAVALCRTSGLEEVVVARAGKRELQTLAMLCAECPLKVTGTEGWGRAMLTRGGVALKELDPQTLAAQRISNLYCIGEVVDVDAPCGGYNLSWAFASGFLAAQAINSVGSRQ
jgi:predicted Rossmann fold flavoprotein